jgi:hypothetical protein
MYGMLPTSNRNQQPAEMKMKNEHAGETAGGGFSFHHHGLISHFPLQPPLHWTMLIC